MMMIDNGFEAMRLLVYINVLRLSINLVSDIPTLFLAFYDNLFTVQVGCLWNALLEATRRTGASEFPKTCQGPLSL